MNIDKIKEALGKVNDPELNRDLVSLNMIRDIKLYGEKLSFTVVFPTPPLPELIAII